MATIEQGLHAHLIADGGVSALVAARIYPLRAPQNPTVPYVTYSRINTDREHHMSGASGLAHPHFQIDVFASSFSSMSAVANAIRSALDVYSGDMGSPSIDVSSVLVVDERDFYEDDTNLYHDAIDVSIWHTE